MGDGFHGDQNVRVSMRWSLRVCTTAVPWEGNYHLNYGGSSSNRQQQWVSWLVGGYIMRASTTAAAAASSTYVPGTTKTPIRETRAYECTSNLPAPSSLFGICSASSLHRSILNLLRCLIHRSRVFYVPREGLLAGFFPGCYISLLASMGR